MNPERCVMLARNKGYRYAGLMGATGCYGGNTDPWSATATQCTIPCSGGFGICGADSTASMWATGKRTVTLIVLGV